MSMRNHYLEAELRAAFSAAGCGIVRHRAATPVSDDADAAEPAAPRQPTWHDLIPRTPGEPSLQQLLRIVSMRTGISLPELCSLRRRRDIVRARQIFYAVARTLTSKSFPQIGKAIGGRDHSTVLYGCRMVDEKRAYFDPDVSEILSAFPKQEVGTP